MNSHSTIFSLDGRTCTLARVGDGPLPLVIWPGGETAELDALLDTLKPAFEQDACRPFALLAFSEADWNRGFSPWPAPALFPKDGPFPGGGGETLAWLESALLPEAARQANLLPGAENTLLLGYSLAGLFSLWAFYETGRFGGCACCSGSLWYEGWNAYQQKAKAKPNSRVYLSLGNAEEKARNPVMARVGEATRQTAARLEADPDIRDTTLVWHGGGHFKDVPARLAAGLGWLLRP